MKTDMIRVRARTTRHDIGGVPARLVVAGTPGMIVGFSAHQTAGRAVRAGVSPSPDPYLTIAWDAAATTDDLTNPDAMTTAPWPETDVDPDDVEFISVVGVEHLDE